MSLSQDATLSTDLHSTVRRIEEWLLRSEIQIPDGQHRGGVAGWLDNRGTPEFLYLEIAGYFMTSMAWLSAGAASSPENVDVARRRARRASAWVASLLSRYQSPPTRLYLSGLRADWRNDGVFSFDLAMAARGLAGDRQFVGRRERRRALSDTCARIERISCGADVMVSHDLLSDTRLPDRWSTRPGPHHLKAAAAVLRLPRRTISEAMIGVAERTCDHWAQSFADEVWPCRELHAVLYAMEGMLLQSPRRDRLADVSRVFARVMELQAPDGTLPESVDGGIARSDVLAQALRVGQLLRAHHHLHEPVWTGRLDRLTEALLGFVRPDGGVLFARHQPISNTWCAMFAHQALYLRARDGTPDALPRYAFDLLV